MNSVATSVERLEQTASGIERAISSPIKKAAGFAAGVGEAVSFFLSGKRSKEE